MKKRMAILLSIALALILSLTSLSVCIGEAAEAAEAADIGLEALFASSWQDYSVRSDDYLMLVLTIHTDLDLASFRRADNGEKLDWTPGITRSMKNGDGVLTEKTWIIGIAKEEAELDVIVTFSDGSEYPIPHEQEVEKKEADAFLLGTWSGASYGGNWYFRFTEDTLRMVQSDDEATLDQEGKYTELPLIWRDSETVWVVITDENMLPILEMNEKSTTATVEGEELTVVPLIYIAGDTGASLSYYSTWHGKQTISLKKVSE